MQLGHVNDLRYGCKILLHRSSSMASEPELKHYWTGFKFECYNKWRWYFRYRCALLQVQYPKRYAEFVSFNFEYQPPINEIRKRLIDRQRSAKAKVTEFANKIELAKKHWNQLFPIEEDDLYKRAMGKVESKKKEVIELQNQIDAL